MKPARDIPNFRSIAAGARCARLALATLFAFTAGAGFVFAGTYYVATDGDDTAAGTQAAPWKTIAHAVREMNAGDTTFVKGGVYHEKLIRFRKSGTAAAPINLLNAPGESPVVDFGVSKTNRVVHRFEIRNGAGATTPTGWITIEGFEIRRGYDGIKFLGAHDITIRRNWIHHSSSQGILGSGKNIDIDRNTISHNDDSHLDHGLYLSGSDYKTSNNLIYGNATYGIQVAGYLWEGSTHYKPMKGALPDPSYTGAANFLIAHNTFAYQGSAGMVIWQSAAVNSRVVNNIFHENGVKSRSGSRGVNGVDFLGSGHGHVLNNNLFFATGSGGTRMFGGKAVEGTHYTQTGNLTADPRFRGAGATLPDAPDFHLTAESPAIDKGLPLPEVANDREGAARPWPSGGAHDIGAYEHAFAPAASAPVPPSARGPLRVHPTNPRYFTDGTKNADGSLRAVYLTGSHVWNTLQDQGMAQSPPAFDFNGYLDFLARHGHNFTKLWRFELTEWNQWNETKPPLRFTTHHPWKRTGPGTALDGLPKFDLTQWDEEHFERLRSRVKAAGERGIYVAIMLFEGCLLREQPSPWSGYPMNAANNINGINGDPNGDGRGLEVQMLKVEAITEIQKAYIRRVVDAVNDLDNVLYEISNESLFTPEILKWQAQLLNHLNEYQATKPRQHPAGMTTLVAFTAGTKLASNNALLDSRADWVSPGATIYGPADPYSVNPPATTGKKVVILDTDHTWNNACTTRTSQQRADHAWVWKSFLRGYNPIYMDPLDLTQPDGVLTYAKDNACAIVLARPAMGHTRAYAERMNLAAMTPRNELSSTQYCLANPGSEYLVYLPDGGEVTVDVSAAKGALTVEWFDPTTAEKRAGEDVAGGAKRLFQAPFKGDAVLYLRAE